MRNESRNSGQNEKMPKHGRSKNYQIGCDIGGTFTDFVLFDENTGDAVIEKCLSTPSDPSQGLMTGFEALKKQAGDYFSRISKIAHASTLVANAVVERKGARCALLCTKGFRDIIEVRRHVRVTTYELWSDPPEPLIPRYLRLPINERTYSNGEIVQAIDPDEIAEVAKFLKEQGVESVAIAFLHSYRNPANEIEAQRLLAAHLPGIPITTSAAVLPQMKEYERTSTTVVNAYVRPIVERYLANLTNRLERSGIEAPIHIMLSNGGVASPKAASDFPIRLIESGPVAGAKVAQYYRDLCGLGDVLAYDMGGTTAKACLIRDGRIPITEELEVARSQRFTKSSGYPVAVPGAHLIEIGAGGGSIAEINKLELIQVGPESASADPGPVCYGRGGQRPTVTDADLCLGYINPAYFAGGTMSLSVEAAREAIQRDIAKMTDGDVTKAAWSIHDVINETMASAVRMHTIERGGAFDAVTMVAFGGAGPVHAYNLARKLGIGQLLVPLRAGVLSAMGLLIAPPAYDLVRTFRVGLTELDGKAIENAYLAMEKEIERLLREVERKGKVSFARSADVGYLGQGYQVTVPTNDLRGAVRAEPLWDRFGKIYREKYGYFYDDIPGELVNLRVNGEIRGAQFELKKMAAADSKQLASVASTRQAYSPARRSMIDFQVCHREDLAPGFSIPGPVLVEEISSTTMIDVGGAVIVDEYGSLLVTVDSI